LLLLELTIIIWLQALLDETTAELIYTKAMLERLVHLNLLLVYLWLRGEHLLWHMLLLLLLGLILQLLVKEMHLAPSHSIRAMLRSV